VKWLKWSENWWFTKCLTFPFVVFVVAGFIVYVLAVVVSFIVVFLYCVCASNVCNVCYLSVLLLYYCHRAKVQLQFNIYINSSTSGGRSVGIVLLRTKIDGVCFEGLQSVIRRTNAPNTRVGWLSHVSDCCSIVSCSHIARLRLNSASASNIWSPLFYVGFEVLTALVVKIAKVCCIALCSSQANRHFGGTFHLHLQGRKSTQQETNMNQVARHVRWHSSLVL
jgi:hypothetical protein